jgi:MerR family mercuric resistance operon transcriptional regulator
VNGLRSGAVASAAGVNTQTLRYYERRGLLAEPSRTLGGHRVYPAETVTVLRVIKAAQRLGFTLAEVADLLEVGAHRHSSRQGSSSRQNDGLAGRIETKLAEVETKLVDLTVIRETLRAALAVGCDDLVTCAQTPDCPLPFAGLAPSSRLPLKPSRRRNVP